MLSFDDVVTQIKSELEYQDKKYLNNAGKPLEVWLLVSMQYMNDSIERYGHGTQAEAREKLMKAITCGIRALMSDKAIVKS